MKQILIFLITLILLMVIIPLTAYSKDIAMQTNKSISILKDRDPEDVSYTDFKLLDKSSNEIITVKDKDFLYGAVAAEMPISFNTEALKAQAVASYSFFYEKRIQARKNSNEYDFECNSDNWQVFVTKEMMKEKWGNNFEENFKKLSDAIDSVDGKKIVYNDEVIMAAYHAISGGTTEDCAVVWGSSAEYLRATESPGDLLAPDYQTRVTISKENFEKLLKENLPDITLSNLPENWIQSPAKSPSGTVITIEIGDKKLSGSEVRSIFSLRSSNFDLKYIDNDFVFDVRGYGHGVGMSQYGANAMANQGASYEEIIKWYYSGTEIL